MTFIPRPAVIVGGSRRSALGGWSLLAACVIGVSGCSVGSSEGGPSQAAVADEPAAVDTAIATAGSFEAALTFTGTTQPIQEVALRSRVDGQVTLLTVDVGDAVAADEMVARLDADLLTVEVNQAQAELRARQSEVAQAKASVSDAQTALESARVQLQQAQTETNRL
ncbi:MAG: biotin/lipoyl-binding protein, partial [Cyanobacteria bacterium P01_H01_bin.153]